MQKSKVAIVTNDECYKKPLRDLLIQERLEIDIWCSASECIENSLQDQYNLYIIDSWLSDYNGYLLVELLRNKTSAPIIFISDDYEESNVVRAFGLGVDEYLPKPVRLKELTVRSLVMLKKYHTQLSSNIIKVNGVIFNKKENIIYLNGNELSLTPTELKLLKILLEHAGEAIATKDLLTSVWGWDETMGTQVVSTNINRLRKKIGKEKISTVKGRGYKFELL